MGDNTLLSALADSKTSIAFWTIFLGVYSLVITYVVFRFFYLLWGAGKGPIKHYGEDRRKLVFKEHISVPQDILHSVEYWKNSRGMLQCAQIFKPAEGEIKTIIVQCVGYGDTNYWLPRERAIMFAKKGYAVIGLDYEGAGCSDGLHNYIPDFEQLVQDVWDFITEIRNRDWIQRKPLYLLGESMGGAVAIKLALREKREGLQYFNGAILLAPMCKIKQEMKPPEILINTLNKAFRRKEILELALQNPYAYTMKPRLSTALQLLKATESINRQMEEFELPLLVLQGSEDKVTDPAIAIEFARRASSKDKTLKVYEGFWHSLLAGETPENILKVYGDIFDWLEARVSKAKK